MTIATEETIRISCECGKNARVPANYAGRRVRCGRCKAAVLVPGERLQATVRASAKRRAPQQAIGRYGELDLDRDLDLAPAKPRKRRPAASDPYAPPRARVDEDAKQRRRPLEDGARNRDLKAEGHIAAIGVWNRISAVFLLAAAGLSAIFAGKLGIVFAAILGVFGFLYWWLGSSLMSYSRTARAIQGALTILGVLGCVLNIVASPDAGTLFGNLISLGWNGAILWALFGERASRVFAPGYRTDRRPVSWWASPFFYLPILLFVLAAGLGIMAAMAL